MKDLETIKEEEAAKRGYKHWSDCVNQLPKWNLEDLLSQIAERYANEVSKALLDEAAEKADKVMHKYGYFPKEESPFRLKIEESILSLIPKDR